MKPLGLSVKKKLLENIHSQYQNANWQEKNKLLDSLILTTRYSRKYAIKLLNQALIPTTTRVNKNPPIYDEPFKQALMTLWYAANQICSKRFVPFLPELLSSLEKHGYLHLPEDVRRKILTVSCSTVDRLLKKERQTNKRSLSTTRSGSLLKKQIKIRTFADWNDTVPGFFEADLVAHCGGSMAGSFLNTLVLVDIETTWLECIPLLHKRASDVIASLKLLDEIMPISILGFDTDNGSEFINYELFDYCEMNEITFTRSRAYKKNDQAHVEQKNGSVVRRIIGHGRFEGYDAWSILSELYSVLRLYVNFFQPTLKWVSKKRIDSKTIRYYDKARTPFRRIIESTHIDQQTKTELELQYQKLDPIALLKDIEKYQNKLWQISVNEKSQKDLKLELNEASKEEIPDDKKSHPNIRATREQPSENPLDNKKKREWRTRKDPFDILQNSLELRLELNPLITAKELLDELIKSNPETINIGHLRTLQRRISKWRKESSIHEEKLREIMQNAME